jgi:hypothetical protein
MREMPEFLRAPLCPAGHLPLKGGDQQRHAPTPILQCRWLAAWFDVGVISPLEGEMSGRTEGGDVERESSRLFAVPTGACPC